MQAADYEGFARALCDPAAALPGGLHAPDDAVLEERFAVYRNNVHVSLVESLGESCPIVREQVGEEFFRAMARAYVQQHKPATPLLTCYGDDFPQFIDAFEPASTLPWLPDLARLELAWLASWAAQDAPAMRLTALRNLRAGELALARVRAHPAVRLLRSAWPVADLWEAHQSARPDLSSLQWHPQNVLLTRPQSEVLLRRLDDSAADFTLALIEGETIEAAAARATGLDAGALLGQLVDAGLILEICR